MPLHGISVQRPRHDHQREVLAFSHADGHAGESAVFSEDLHRHQVRGVVVKDEREVVCRGARGHDRSVSSGTEDRPQAVLRRGKASTYGRCGGVGDSGGRQVDIEARQNLQG